MLQTTYTCAYSNVYNINAIEIFSAICSHLLQMWFNKMSFCCGISCGIPILVFATIVTNVVELNP